MAKIGINIATGSLQKDDIIVGIDLGTTNSLVAIIHPDTKQPMALKEYGTNSLVPSIIHFSETGNVIVGEEARTLLESAPQRTIYSAKRLMGKSYQDIKTNTGYFSYKVIDDNTESLVKVQLGNQFFSPIELSSLILKELKQRAEHILKTPVLKAVITVPAYFNDAQRQATRDAGKLAGLDVLRIINEPTAASLAYGFGLKSNQSQTVVVYDLGGGTFDVSVLRIVDGVFEVLSTNGDTYLGGDDFDRTIIDYWIDTTGINKEELQKDKSLLQSFRLKAEAAKKVLSVSNEFEDEISGTKISISREKFEELITPLIVRTIDSCRNAVKDAEIKINEIDAVLMVGGSTRIPLVQDMVGGFFQKKVNNDLNPDEVVALGAAIQADILAGNNRDMLLLDITPLSLGIETAGGLMDVLVPRNAKIPSKASRQYTTQVDGQSSMRISVYQGERDMVINNRKLAEFNLSNIPGMPAGLPKVEIGFLINADGILTVTAKELRSGIAQHIEIRPQYGLTDLEVESMLKEAIDHAQEDIATRALAEARTEGEQLLKTTENFLQKNTNHLIASKLIDTANAMQALQLAITMNDKNLIQEKIEQLNATSRPYAERIMDIAVAEAIKGKIV
jgi:molecular chaperone HscA